jgi:hypothetical protein
MLEWIRSGLWDFSQNEGGVMARKLEESLKSYTALVNPGKEDQHAIC